MLRSDLPSNEFKQGHFAKVPVIVNRDVRQTLFEDY